MMKLQKFISETLTQIIQGVEDAQGSIVSGSGRVNPRIIDGRIIEDGRPKDIIEKDKLTPINFDIAVYVQEEKNKVEGIGVAIASVGLGLRKKIRISDSSISRIKFKVPVVLPQKTKKQ